MHYSIINPFQSELFFNYNNDKNYIPRKTPFIELDEGKVKSKKKGTTLKKKPRSLKASMTGKDVLAEDEEEEKPKDNSLLSQAKSLLKGGEKSKSDKVEDNV